LVVFCGNISQVQGKSDIRLFAVEPLKPISFKLYRCDSTFYTEVLEEMLEPDRLYGIIVLDKKEATLAMIKGKKTEILIKLRSSVPGKTRAGGQSALRFSRLREEALEDFFKKVAEEAKKHFTRKEVLGIIVGGPGLTKQEFLDYDLLDHRIKKKIIGMVDSCYSDESGVREVLLKSQDLLRETTLMHELRLMNKFFEEIAKDGLVAYGLKEVEEALKNAQVSVVLISEKLDLEHRKYVCNGCGYEEEVFVKEEEDIDRKCPKCGALMELVEEEEYVDHVREMAEKTGAEVELISTDTSEGKQFFLSFGGIGALLRFKV
jgi:peptide chain release factor subunit 1